MLESKPRSSARAIMITSTEQSLQSPSFGFWLFLLGLVLEHRDSCTLGKCSTAELHPRAGELSLQVLNPQWQLMRLRPVPGSKAAPLVTSLLMFLSVSHTAPHLLCKASAQHSNLQLWAPDPSKDLHFFSCSCSQRFLQMFVLGSFFPLSEVTLWFHRECRLCKALISDPFLCF